MSKMPEHILEGFVRKNKGVWPDSMCERYFNFDKDYDEVYYGDYKAVCEKLGWKMVYLTSSNGLRLPQVIFKIGDTVKDTDDTYGRVGEVMCEEHGKEICVKFKNGLDIVKVDDLARVPTIEEELTDFVFQNSGIRSRDGGLESATDVAKAILDKYNITKKEDKCN